MVETLTNVNKSGKVKTGAEGEQGNEAAARMKKYLSSLGRKKHCGLLTAIMSHRLTPSSAGHGTSAYIAIRSADRGHPWKVVVDRCRLERQPAR